MNGTGQQTSTATPKQIDYLKKLCTRLSEFDRPAAVEVWKHLGHLQSGGALTIRRASHEIDSLMTRVVKAQDAARAIEAAPVPFVEAGRYAIDNNEGTLAFYRVAVKDGVNTAVYVYASDEQRKLPAKAAAGVLRKLAATDLEAASIRFGQETRKCRKCGKRLTREESRAIGTGPECVNKA